MKTNRRHTKASTCRWAVALMAVVAATTTRGAAPALQGSVNLRPLTPDEIEAHSLTGAEATGGLSAIGVGQPAYLEALVNTAVPASDIQSATWVLTNQPIGSTVALQPSPLGTNVPTYNPADQIAFQVAGRTLLRPDVAGQYTVVATIVTGSSGSTNITQTLTAGTYMGANTCALCHSGGVIADNVWVPWSQTPHASFFARSIDGGSGSYYNQSCISCHTVGYDANTNAVNGGFDDVAKKLGWTFPPVLTNGNWASMQANYPTLANLANIQCENCHGPGSEHVAALGNTNVSNWPRIGISMGAGNCSQCHAEQPFHIKSAEWSNSGHAIAPRDPAGSAGCVGCHTAAGFAGRVSGWSTTNTAYEAITCAACHDPHDSSNPHQLRPAASVTLKDGTTVTTNTAGVGVLCMECHMSRQNATNYVETAPGSTHFGPHHGPQADMLMGVNGVTYGATIPSSAHRSVVPDACVTCHMQTVSANQPGYLNAGGHTFNVAWAGSGTNPPVQLTAACEQCHGPIDSFNLLRQDYDGDGVIEGVQTEVQHLMDRLAYLLPPVGVAKTNLNIDSTWTRQQLRAAYNYLFVQSDGSRGVHNLSYTVGLLKGSIADMTGVSVQGGLPDAWVTKYFGAVNNPNGFPNATPAGDGVPNWLKYALGLDPTVPGLVVPDGVVWADGNLLSGGSSTNSIRIFTAAEVAFETEVGKTYQIQAISSLGAGWVNIGTPITGNGQTMSYVTPTRNNVQQYYRVVAQ